MRRKLAAMLLKRLAVGLAALAAATVSAFSTGTAPVSVAVNYNVLRNGLHVAVVNERFESSAGHYRIVSRSTAVGIAALIKPRPVTLTSAGRVTPEGLKPEQFEGSRGADDPRQASADFDWSGGSLTLRHDGKAQRVELPTGTQDRLSAMYQFMFYSYGEQRELRFPMTNGRKLDRYRYAIKSEEEIDTSLGRMKTLHLVKQREPDDSETEIWLAPAQRYLPVKMLIVESDGVRYEQFVTHLDIRP